MAESNFRSRRRKDRAQVYRRLRGVYFSCPAISPREFRVKNISELGIGVKASSRTRNLQIGEVVKAELTVGYSVAQVSVKVVHFDKTVVGFEFVSPAEEIKAAIRAYFESEQIGASLKLRTEDGESLTYADGTGNHLRISVDHHGKVAQFTFGVLGNKITWDRAGGLHLIQNGNQQPLSDYMRGQLVSLIRNAHHVHSSYRESIERALTFLLGA